MNNREENKPLLANVINAGKGDGQNNPFLELPRELHRQIFSFLYKQDVARVGRVCKEMYRASRDPLVLEKSRTLPYEPLDYSRLVKTEKYSSFPEYWSLVSLSNGNIVILEKESNGGLFHPNFRRDGTRSVIILTLDKNRQLEQSVLTKGDYYLLANFANYLFAAKRENGSCVVELWNISKPADQQRISQINMGNDSFYQIVGLSKHTFATVNRGGVLVWDFTLEAGRQCIKTFPQLASCCSSIVPLSDTQFICAGRSAQAPSVITVYDVTQPDGQECIRKIEVDTDVRNMTMLSNGLIAYMSFKQRDRALNQEISLDPGQITILDLTKPAGQECIKVIKVNSGARLQDIVTLPNGYFATFTAGGWFKAFNLNVLLKAKGREFEQNNENEIISSIKDLILLPNDEIILYPLSGGTPSLLKFAPLKPELESDKSIIESIKEEVESRCSIM